MKEQLLAGKLDLPNYQAFVSAIGPEMANLADKLFQALWYQYLKDKGTINSTYWSSRFNNPFVFNQVIMSLSKAGWLISHAIPARNWAEMHINEDKLLEFVSQQDLEQIRAFNKHRQYLPTHELSTIDNLTRINGKSKSTGLQRTGFMKAGNSQYKYDTQMMQDYSLIIQANLTKSMDKIAQLHPSMRHDRASYDTISIEIFDHLVQSNETYTRGNNYSDSRGRAISSALSKVANPISQKDFRALLIIGD
jgi:hypothetical protein